MATNPKWINVTPAYPLQAQFGTTGGLGSPLCINSITGKGYFLNGTTITPLNAASIASSRSALAGFSSSDIAVFLTESGREGYFVWSGSNLSTFVTADPNQGIYVAPSTDTTGASGAWVRKFSGYANVQWWGAKGDGVTNDYAAINAALNTLYAIRLQVSQYGAGASYPLFFPLGNYYCGSNTIQITWAAHLIGISTGMAGGAGSQITWADQTSGLFFNGTNIGNANPAGWHVENLFLNGGFVSGTSNEGEFHGLTANWQGTVRSCQIFNFPGDGLYLTGNGPTTSVDQMLVESVFVSGCRRGVYTAGGDSNAMTFINCDFNFNRQSGIWEAGFLGNSYIGCLCEANGNSSWNTGAVNHPCHFVSYSGNRYACAVGQETWCSTNAPSGTTANNTGWIFWQAGGTGVGIPAWSSGIHVRAGGELIHTGANNQSSFTGCYCEGDAFNQVDARAVIVGPLGAGSGSYGMVFQGGTISSAKPAILYANGGLITDSTIAAGGIITFGYNDYLGAQTGIAGDYDLTLNSTNAYAGIYGKTWSAGVPTTLGHMQFFGSGIKFDTLRGGTAVIFNVNGAMAAQFLSTGLWLPSGTTVSINGNQVVGPRQANVAQPTGGTTIDTQARTAINGILALLQAHGLMS